MSVYPKANVLSKKYSKQFTRGTHTITHSLATCPDQDRVKNLSKKFVDSYYNIFDQTGRTNLESQYNADAFFSFSSTHPMPSVGRNLIEVTTPESRISLLIHEKKTIAQVLANFSPTEHLSNMLTIDVPYYDLNTMNVTSMQIVVTGVFKDTSQATNSLRAFTRIFFVKLVSINSTLSPTYEIFNDIFMLQPPTPEQIKRYHQQAQIAKQVASGQKINDRVSGSSGERTELDILRSVMAKTKMNKDGAKQLLDEFRFDEAAALGAFQTLSAENKIPQEFFVV